MELGLKNYMEDLVRNRLSEVLKTMPEICTCDRCKMDIMAFALNNCPPKYIVTSKGQVYAKLSVLQGQFDADVVRSIVDAAVRVNNKPRHGESVDVDLD